jgi:tRNA uridine 5-carboxymethylaminomethyl modification enzyme
LGLLSGEEARAFKEKVETLDRLRAFLTAHRWDPVEGEGASIGHKLESQSVKGTSLEELLRRPGIVLDDLKPVLERHGLWAGEGIRRSAEIEARYAGYIQQQMRDAARIEKAAARVLPEGLNYQAIDGLSREVREKLSRIRPKDLGMASRIPGVTAAAISVLNIYLELAKKNKQFAE